jgi:hypothetical protein
MRAIDHRLLTPLLIGTFLLLSLQGAAAREPGPAVQPAPLVAPEGGRWYNANLIQDGDAESPYTTRWHDNEGFMQIRPYGGSCDGLCSFPSPYDPGPVQRGAGFFYMGDTSNHYNGTNMWLNDKIALAAIQAAIDTGRVRYVLSGYFGGDGDKPTTAQLHMFFETGTGSSNGEVIVGNVTPAERQNRTGLLYREKAGFVPAGTQYINLDLQTGYFDPDSNLRTGYADNLSLILIPIRTFVPLVVKGPGDQEPPETGFPAPTGVTATPNGLTRMDIRWTDNSSTELGFEVQRVNPDATVDTICNTSANVAYCFDPGISQHTATGYVYLGNQVSYTYRVRAVGAGINSAWASGAGTTAQQPLAPPSPTKGSFTCQAIETTSSSTTFVWNDPFDYEAGFNLYVNGNSSPSWSMLENGTRITFVNQVPGTITLKIAPFVYNRTNPGMVYEGTSCTASAHLPSPSSSGITRFYNDASYPVISLTVDGWEQFPVRPLGILPGAYFELDGVASGQHSWTAVTGFWDDLGRRFSMYAYTGAFSQPASGSYAVHIPDMTIRDLLTVPPANLGYWEGYYFDTNGNCYTTAFRFKQDGTFTFYNSNTQVDSGTYSLVQREPAIFSTRFHVTSSKQNVDGLLVETRGQFFMNNGPASWQQITYVYKPQGYVRNAFCP